MGKYLNIILDRCAKQIKKGVSKYGIPLERNFSVDFEGKLDYLAEELTDALFYIEWLREEHRKIMEESKIYRNQALTNDVTCANIDVTE